MQEQKFDKDIELLKITLLSEEIRSSHNNILALWIGLYVTILAGAFALVGVTDRTEVSAFGVFFVVFLVYFTYQATSLRLEYDSQLSELHRLLKMVEEGHPIDEFEKLLKNFRRLPKKKVSLRKLFQR